MIIPVVVPQTVTNGQSLSTPYTYSPGAGLGPAATAAVTVDCGSTIVSNTNDNGAGSLRQAILDACPGGTVTFAAGLTSGGPATITLTSGELFIDKGLTVIGPGADVLSVSGNNASRVLNIQSGTVRISGLALINGHVTDTDSGAGVMNRGNLTLISCAITDNTGANRGAGLANFADTGPATLTIVNSTISGNIAGILGSGLFNTGYGGTVNLINSTVTGNGNGSFFGGGIYNSAGRHR